MNVIFTVVVFAAFGLWVLAIFRRLVRLRAQVKLAWERLEADQSSGAIKSVYNSHVTTYNAALESFPAYVVAPLAGLKPARHFESTAT